MKYGGYRPGYRRSHGAVIKDPETKQKSAYDRSAAHLKPCHNSELSKELRAWRVFRRLHQWAAGQHFGVSASEISLWERRGVPERRRKDVAIKLLSDAAYFSVSSFLSFSQTNKVKDELSLAEDNDPWIDLLANISGDIVRGMERLTSTELKEVVGLGTRATPQDTHRVASIMRRLGWTGPKMLWINGRSAKGYERAV